MNVSANYRMLSLSEIIEKMVPLDKSWQDRRIPKLQRELVAGELERYRAGEPMAHFDALRAVLGHLPVADVVPTLLDVGAASGYYREVLQIQKFDCRYTAVDYSENFKKLAESIYGDEIEFDIGDARELPYRNGTFDIVLSGSCILHIVEYETAIAEAARVSKKYVIFHRTPINRWPETVYFEKLAYGVPCIEIHFREKELFDIFGELKLDLVAQADIFGTNHKTYLLQKTK